MSKALVQTNKELSDDMLLGHMFFYQIPSDLKMTPDELKDLVLQVGLDDKYVRKISRRDAFRRATSSIKEQKIAINWGGASTEVKLNVDDVKVAGSKSLIRLIGRKTIDGDKEEVDYEKVGRIELSEQGIIREINPNYASEYNYDLILEEAEKRFNFNANYHNRETVRNMMVRIVKSLYPISLMDNGIAKFIPISSKEELYALQEFGRALNNYSNDPSTFEIIPVIDTLEQRELVHRQAVSFIKSEMTEVMGQMAKVLKDKSTLTPKQAAGYIEKIKHLQEKTQAYESTVDMHMTFLEEQVKAMLKQVEVNTEQ